METGLRGKRVLVTGASGGIGSACVAAFLAEGAEIVAHYHQGRERAEALGDVTPVQADLTREDEAERLFEEAGQPRASSGRRATPTIPRRSRRSPTGSF